LMLTLGALLFLPGDFPDRFAAAGVTSRPLPMKLMVDRKTGDAFAVFAQPLPGGAAIHMRVVRGPVQQLAHGAVDCNAVARVPRVATSAPEPLGKVRVYAGIRVDAAQLQAPPLAAHRTPIALAPGRSDEAFIEACVLDNGRVIASLRSLLYHAVDVYTLRQAYFARVLADQWAIDGIPRTVIIDDPAPTQPLSTQAYAQYCEQELGPIPWFQPTQNTFGFGTYDCGSFATSYVTVETQYGIPSAKLLPKNVLQNRKWDFSRGGRRILLWVDDEPKNKCQYPSGLGTPPRSSYDCVYKCDRAQWMSVFSDKTASCEPGPTISAIQNEQGSYFALLCREVQGQPGTNMALTKTFTDIALIGFNPNKGKGAACFFQNRMTGVATNGSNIPDPADPVNSLSFWRSAAECDKCHAASAFIHSPWIDQAQTPATGQFVRPLTDWQNCPDPPPANASSPTWCSDANAPPQADPVPVVPILQHDYLTKDDPYFIYMADKVLDTATGKSGATPIPAPYDLSTTPAALCGSCHRFPSGNFLTLALLGMSYGADLPSKSPYFHKLTDTGLQQSQQSPFLIFAVDPPDPSSSEWTSALQYLLACNQGGPCPPCPTGPCESPFKLP
jgi:hypothetical protein